ncbi:MAG: type II secretion system protein GspG, partial [Bryobacteraceae bacterium]
MQINNFEQALSSFKLNTGVFPNTELGLEALRTKPANITQWEG